MKLRILLSATLAILSLLAVPTDASAVILNLNGQRGWYQTFQNDSNVTISSLNDVHSIIWQGLLPLSRGGTGASSFTNGSIPFIFNGTFSEDNLNLFWDNLNKFLGVGTSSPTTTLDVLGNAKATSITTTSDSVINSLNIGKGGGSVSSNTAFGIGALSSNSTGYRNVAIGNSALSANTTDGDNTAVGFQALKNLASGSHNTALGYDALLSLVSGGDSTAIGALALGNSTTGSDANTAVGMAAMGLNTTGSYNTAIGSHALNANRTGNRNVALGYDALFYNDTGAGSNIAIGFRSGAHQADLSSLTSPQYSIYIGTEARGYNNNDFNSIVMGNATIGAGANTTVIGNSSMTDIYFGSASGNADIHGTKLFLGSSNVPGCIIMGDSDGNGVTYLTVNDGVLSASTTPPSACQ